MELSAKTKSKYRIITSANLIGYHGTDKKLGEFRTGVKTYRYLLFKAFEQESQGVFFALTPDEAKEYGKYVYKAIINNPKLFISLDETHVGVNRLDEKREKELAAMLIATAKDGDKGKRVEMYKNDIYIPDNFDPKNKEESNWLWIYDAVSDGIVWDVLDEPKFVEKMKKFGYDGTIAEETNMASGKSIFVCNIEKIGTPELVN